MTGHKRYLVPSGFVRVEDVISRSRFITSLDRADSVGDARSFVDSIKTEYPEATHNCWAYLIGAPGSTGQVGMSDDGEPHGTAGRPMLSKLIHSGAGDLAAVVTRYFGGSKLGKGGLVRAYSGCVQHALDEAELIERISWRNVRLVLDYSLIESLKRMYPEFEVNLVAEEFKDTVVHSLRIPEEHADSFAKAVLDKSNGRVACDWLD